MNYEGGSKMNIIKNRYGELRSGWVITLIIVLIIVAQGIGSSLVPENGDETSISLIMLVTLVYGVISIGGGIVLFKLLYKRSLRQIGLITVGLVTDLLHGITIGVVSMVLVFSFLLLTGQATTSLNMEKLIAPVLIANLISVSITAFSEELLVRGFMMTALKTTRNKWVVFLASSIIFSLVHLLNPWATILSLTNTFLAGLLFAYMFVKSGKLWLPTGFHLAWNFLQGDVFGMNVSGQAQLSAFSTTMGTNTLLTGGNAGPEGGLLVTLVLLLGMAYVYYIVKPPSEPHWEIDSDLPLR